MSNGQRRGPGTWARPGPPVSRSRAQAVAGRPALRRMSCGRLGAPSTGSCPAAVAAVRQWTFRSARKRRRYDYGGPVAAPGGNGLAAARLAAADPARPWSRPATVSRSGAAPPSRLPGQDDPGSVWGRAPPACSCADPLDSFHAMPPAVWEACLVRFEYKRHSFCRCHALQRPRPRPHPADALLPRAQPSTGLPQGPFAPATSGAGSRPAAGPRHAHISARSGRPGFRAFGQIRDLLAPIRPMPG